MGKFRTKYYSWFFETSSRISVFAWKQTIWRELSNTPNLGSEHFHWLFFFQNTTAPKNSNFIPKFVQEKGISLQGQFHKIGRKNLDNIIKNEIQAKGFRMI